MTRRVLRSRWRGWACPPARPTSLRCSGSTTGTRTGASASRTFLASPGCTNAASSERQACSAPRPTCSSSLSRHPEASVSILLNRRRSSFGWVSGCCPARGLPMLSFFILSMVTVSCLLRLCRALKHLRYTSAEEPCAAAAHYPCGAGDLYAAAHCFELAPCAS